MFDAYLKTWNISGNLVQDSGVLEPNAVGANYGVNFVTVQKQKDLLIECDSSGPLKLVQYGDDAPLLVDATDSDWDGPVYGGTFMPNEKDVEFLIARGVRFERY